MVRVGILTVLAVCLGVRAAEAFCGFYVATNDAPMFNDATQVVLMRKGTRTVLSMRNNYKGPPDAFAMVIPVPTVLKEADVKTLTSDVFAAVDQMGSPRLVEYWEQDPCRPDVERERNMDKMRSSAPQPSTGAGRPNDLGVTVEAQFVVGEYQIVILSAKDSTGLDTWLRREKYQIPIGAEPLLRPYVEAGMKFFVAKVDPAKVKFEPGANGSASAPGGGEARAVLSPLRFHYDHERFELPIRLGLANSAGTQDLIVHILAPNQRYEVANYPNATIPTNFDVATSVRDTFGAFYVALFDATLARHPGAVITEYAWDASTCDPCPGPTLRPEHFRTLGGDVIDVDRGFVLTRLHARYGKDIAQDLVFREAKPIAGGREHLVGTGKLEEGAQASTTNMFQARYAIRHPWEGPITCENPVRGRWGGPPSAPHDRPVKPALDLALDLAFAPRGTVALADVVRQDIPELNLRAAAAQAVPPANAPATGPKKSKSGCGCAAGGGSGGLVALALAVLLWRRRR